MKEMSLKVKNKGVSARGQSMLLLFQVSLPIFGSAERSSEGEIEKKFLERYVQGSCGKNARNFNVAKSHCKLAGESGKKLPHVFLDRHCRSLLEKISGIMGTVELWQSAFV